MQMMYASHRKRLWTSTACYGYSFTFVRVYVDDVRTSQETRLWSATTLALRVYIYLMFVPHGKHTYGPPRPVTGIALLFIGR
jgi:hypothetical protein